MNTKTNTAVHDYPRLESRPEYKAAADKLNQFRAERERQRAELCALEGLMLARFCNAPSVGINQAIKQGEAVLTGDANNADRLKMENFRHSLRILDKAIEAQEMVVRDVECLLSREASANFVTQHKEIVRRQIDAVLALYEANEAERQFLNEFEELGYRRSLLQTRCFKWADVDPYDEYGATRSWLKEVREYVGEVEAEEKSERVKWFRKNR